MESVKLNEGLLEIGNSAFYQCYALEEIAIPSTVTTIDEGAFCYSPRIKHMVVPASVTDRGNGLFIGCTGLETVIWNAPTPRFPRTTFSHCTALDTVTINTPVTVICDSAFQASGLRTLNGDFENLERIEYTAFNGCSRLENLTQNTKTEKVYLGKDAFSNAPRLKALTLGENTTCFLGDGSFMNCKSLTEINCGSITLKENCPLKGISTVLQAKEVDIQPGGAISMDNHALINAYKLNDAGTLTLVSDASRVNVDSMTVTGTLYMVSKVRQGDALPTDLMKDFLDLTKYVP